MITIHSGGQTGADRAALDWAVMHNVPYEGWVPKGRLSEDGQVSHRFANLKETPSPQYPQRTEWNIRDSDATLIFTSEFKLDGGSLLTANTATRLKKPCFVVHCLNDEIDESQVANLVAWLETNKPKSLNVAGQRASKSPQLYTRVIAYLNRVLIK